MTPLHTITTLLFLLASASAHASSVYIPQIPPDAPFDDKAGRQSELRPLPAKSGSEREDIANLLNNQRLSEYARANAAIGFAGNTAPAESPAPEGPLPIASEPASRTAQDALAAETSPEDGLLIQPSATPAGAKPKKRKATDK